MFSLARSFAVSEFNTRAQSCNEYEPHRAHDRFRVCRPLKHYTADVKTQI